MKLSIVVPAYNEEKRIRSTIEKIELYCTSELDEFEVVVVDDCSSDSTGSIVKSLPYKNIRVLRNKPNRGKGYSVKRGVKSAKYPLILFTDADLSAPIEELKKLLEHSEAYDIVIGSRNTRKSKVERSLFQAFKGHFFAFLVKLIVMKGFYDTQCGFKLFKRDVAVELFSYQTFERFSFDFELLFVAKKHGYKIKEVPVNWKICSGSKVRIIKDTISMTIDLFKLRINDWKGLYKKRRKP
ncbi:MAG TPA: glycosyltransferase family 2 protein [Candidatus Woesearchaeota archaeon]|nr:glycosyltransferase family 2 protein [Candidatus Woesearchaeota archaeon]